jgi:toluene monooxygenase electron transfer component
VNRKITVDTLGGSFGFECAPTERILYAALSHGLSVPYECATGTCGTCRGRVLTGAVDVEWDEAPGFARLKRDKGDVLMCQARPTADCVLRVPANVGKPNPNPPRHRPGRIVEVRWLTHDVIDFEVSLGQPMTFDAGQFVVLETGDVRGGRAYSIVNFGRALDRISLLVKQKPGGRFCDWLFEGDVRGRELNVFGPLGCATFHPEERRNLLCIAGGSGIAGMLSILEHAMQVEHFSEHSGHVFFGVRTLADGFYLEALSAYATAADGKLEVTLALSHEEPAARVHGQFPRIRLVHGMVGDVAARAMAGRYANVVGFIAGPPPMVEGALHTLLREARVPRQFVRYDKFS